GFSFCPRQVPSQCQLLHPSLVCLSSLQLPQLPAESMPFQDTLEAACPAAPQKLIPWVMVACFSVLAFAFTLVCTPKENLSLAEITLQHLTPYLLLSLHLLNLNTHILL
ncbi:hypothetical protein Nmel_008167, partial [Mimus melanotis]